MAATALVVTEVEAAGSEGLVARKVGIGELTFQLGSLIRSYVAVREGLVDLRREQRLQR